MMSYHHFQKIPKKKPTAVVENPAPIAGNLFL